jgi:hypothetical protein
MAFNHVNKELLYISNTVRVLLYRFFLSNLSIEEIYQSPSSLSCSLGKSAWNEEGNLVVTVCFYSKSLYIHQIDESNMGAP